LQTPTPPPVDNTQKSEKQHQGRLLTAGWLSEFSDVEASNASVFTITPAAAAAAAARHSAAAAAAAVGVVTASYQDRELVSAVFDSRLLTFSL
jgi:hypothetical protein